MKHFWTHAIIFLVLLAAIKSFAQTDQDQPKNNFTLAGTQAPAAIQCFSVGKRNGLFKACLTDHGLVTTIETNSNNHVVDHLFGREGYAVCAGATGATIGFDAGSAEQGWNAPTVAQPKGVGKLPLIVTRTSTDGSVQLAQTFNLVAADRRLTIEMELKNISTSTIQLPVLARYFDGDMDGSAGDDMYALTIESVSAQNSQLDALGGIGHGLLLTLDSASLNTVNLPQAESFAAWNPLGSGGQTARRCFAPEPALPTPTPSDQVGRLVLALPGSTLAPGQTTGVTFVYRIF